MGSVLSFCDVVSCGKVLNSSLSALNDSLFVSSLQGVQLNWQDLLEQLL